jgi:hypothetical protein
MKLVGFVVLDILEPVDDTATDLQVGRPRFKPTPPFEGAGAKAPAPRQVLLVQVSCGGMRFVFHHVLRKITHDVDETRVD